LQEISYKTHNFNPDTDDDELSDYDEIFDYGTNPLVADSDGDGIEDGAEIELGLDPLNSDSNQDGVPDGSEKIEQTLSQYIVSDEATQITNVSVTMKGTGLIQNTTIIKNTYGKDLLSSGVVGLIGVPVEINTTSEFEEATITFTYNKALLGNTLEEDLRIMWYDKDNNQYVIMDEETVLNTAANTLSITTSHFSTYLVVDRQAWYDVWSNVISIIDEIDITDTDEDGLYDIFEMEGMMLPNGSVIYTNPQKKDTDGDGLTDAEEMGLIKDSDDQFSLKLLLLILKMFGKTINAEHFDYVSDPTKIDTDGDEYSDYVEVKIYNSNPNKNEVEFHRWNKDYISVNYTGSEPWINRGNIYHGTTQSYGGSQEWFLDDTNKRWYSWLSPGYIIQSVGCGLISLSDILLYLSLKDSEEYGTDITDLISFDSPNKIDCDSYIDYINKMNDTFFRVPRWFGLLGPVIANEIMYYKRFYDLNLLAKWCVSKKGMLPRIIEMLDNDFPITLGIYTSKDDGIYFYDWKPQADDKYNFIVDAYPDKVNNHYVTVTGMMIDRVKNQTILEISSWGWKFYINYDEYIDFIEKNSNYIFNNIVYMLRVYKC
jgi:hypothetical protein